MLVLQPCVELLAETHRGLAAGAPAAVADVEEDQVVVLVERDAVLRELDHATHASHGEQAAGGEVRS